MSGLSPGCTASHTGLPNPKISLNSGKPTEGQHLGSLCTFTGSTQDRGPQSTCISFSPALTLILFFSKDNRHGFNYFRADMCILALILVLAAFTLCRPGRGKPSPLHLDVAVILHVRSGCDQKNLGRCSTPGGQPFCTVLVTSHL